MRVVEMTGDAGDVILAHPLMLHAPVAICSTMPRLVLSGTAFSAGVSRSNFIGELAVTARNPNP